MNIDDNENEIRTSSHWTNQNLKGILEIQSTIIPKRGGAIATNKKRITSIPRVIDNNLMGLTSISEELLPKYLYYFFLGFDLTSISKSAGVPLINNPDIFSIKISLPPIETQRQIVEKLDKQMQALEGVRLLKSEAQKRIEEILAGVWSVDYKLI